MKITFEVEADHPFDLPDAARAYVDALIEQHKSRGVRYTVVESAPAYVVDRVHTSDGAPALETWSQSFFADVTLGTRQR